jgi:hypothetical protein
MSLQLQELNVAIPDLRNLSLERIAELPGFGPRALNRAVPSGAFGNRNAAEPLQWDDRGTRLAAPGESSPDDGRGGVVRRTPTEQRQHQARWPLFDLDVAMPRKTGHPAILFRQFILKVHSRCNLSCTYCYACGMTGQGWRGLPQCLVCTLVEICGGGLYPCRYQGGDGFRHRSVCREGLLNLIMHVGSRVSTRPSVLGFK